MSGEGQREGPGAGGRAPALAALSGKCPALGLRAGSAWHVERVAARDRGWGSPLGPQHLCRCCSSAEVAPAAPSQSPRGRLQHLSPAGIVGDEREAGVPHVTPSPDPLLLLSCCPAGSRCAQSDCPRVGAAPGGCLPCQGEGGGWSPAAGMPQCHPSPGQRLQGQLWCHVLIPARERARGELCWDPSALASL